MMSPIEITLSNSEDSFDIDFDTTPIPIDMADDMSLANTFNETPTPPVDHRRSSHQAGEGEWLHNDAASQQSWFGGGGAGSWYEQTTNSFASCCQMLPDAFMPPRHSFTPPESPASTSQQRVRVARSPPPPPRKPAPSVRRTSPTSAWRSMRSSCLEASQRYYRNDYGNQNYNRSYAASASYQEPRSPAPQPPPPPPPPVYQEPPAYAPPCDPGFLHHSESMDTSEYGNHYHHHHHHHQSYAQPPPEMETPQSEMYAATPQPRKYSNEYREPAPEMPPIVSPTPTYPSPGTVAKATVAEVCDTNSICDDPQVLRPNDIVCGRGAPSQFHQGNAAFREIISSYQTLYLCARRSEKPRIANQVLEDIRKTGGRFVRRTKRGTKSRGAGVGAFAWEEIDEKKALEKVCQALRDGAPELQRQMLAASR